MKRNRSLPSASETAYTAIKKMISTYQLVPGQKMDYAFLAQKLKMSKTPIVNALNRLEQEEFVVSLPNRGFFIKEAEIKEVTELFRVREGLEMIVVEDGIINSTPHMLREIETAMITHAKYDYQTSSRHRQILDASFHLKIAEMTENRNLCRLLKYVFEHIYLRHRVEGLPPQRFAQTAKEHQNILAAIKKKNVKRAKKLMTDHIRAGKIAVMWSLERGDSI